MNKILFLIVFICFSQISLGQETEQDNNFLVNKEKMDVVPISTKGTKLYEYIGRNYRVPDVRGLKGKVVVNFVIDENGNIGDFNIVQDIGHGAAEELIRVLKTTQGKWKAGIKDGKPIKVLYSCPLSIGGV
ncbi:hypothetical protein B6A10_14610 [Flavobacterium sp. L1I52]|uniref:TonB C-terminal domain-containing protein n=1 Tax=Flavobacterium pokkalii TaxID=1940408 RepID=A0ABR7UXI1_9FLAO|nr:energy transducer TonB [Flavobacterium pokkalii]MBD0726409.1 hypothetical protein [Flavobacterium pokkalii]